MSHTLPPANTRSGANLARRALYRTIFRALRNTFLTGPRLLLTSQLSGKRASMMIMLCIPAMLSFAMLTLPPLLFPSPQQQAYYYFSQTLELDPVRWIALTLAAVCAFVALAVPASEDKKVAGAVKNR